MLDILEKNISKSKQHSTKILRKTQIQEVSLSWIFCVPTRYTQYKTHKYYLCLSEAQTASADCSFPSRFHGKV